MDTDVTASAPCQSERMSAPPLSAAPDLRRWPSDPSLLVDTTRCPACFAPLVHAACDVCGLRLDVPAASELLAAGARVRDAEFERQGVITRMRADQAAASAAQLPTPPPPPPARVTAPVAEQPPAPASTPASVPAAPPASGVGSTDGSTTGRPHRSGVQVLLLTLGVVLLSVAAVVFLLVAYLVATLEVRSAITAAASLVVLGLAWLLRARRLPGTAEGVAAVAVVLLVLDVWIVRENDLFGADRLDVAEYWGGALIAVAAVLAGARAVSGVRVPALAAAALAPIGMFLLASGAAPDDEIATAAWLGGTAALVTGALSQLARPSIERVIVLSAGAAGGAIALVAATWALPDLAWGAAWAFLAVGGASLALLLTRLRATRGSADAWTIVVALASGLAFALAPAVGAALELDVESGIWVAPAGAAAAGCLAAAVARIRRRAARRHGELAFLAAAIVASAAAIPAFSLPVVFASDLPAVVTAGWQVDPTALRASGDALGLDDLRVGVVLAPLALAVAAVIAFALLGRLRGLAALPAALALTAAIAGATIAPTVLAVDAVLLAVAAAGLVLAAIRAVRVLPGVVVVLAAFGLSAAVAAWAVAHASVELWWWAVPIIVLLALAGRLVSVRVWSPETARVAGPLHLAAATLVTILGAFSLPGWAAAAGDPFVEPWRSGIFVAGLASALLLGVSALLPGVPRPDRFAVAVPCFGAAAAASTILAVTLATPLGWLPALAFAAAGTAWIRSTLLPVRYAAAASVPFALAFVGTGLVAEYGDPDAVAYALAGAALLAAVLAHAVVPRDRATLRTWSAAVLLLAVVVLVVAFDPPLAPDGTWLVLLLLAPVPLLVAALDGDPIGGTAPSRHLSWASLALAVGSAWAWFARDEVRDVEPYTLPLAAALLVAGSLIAWRRGAPADTVPGRTAVLAAAAAVAVLPSVSTAAESELRTLVLAAAGTLAVIAGLFLPERVRGVPVRLLAVATGWTAVTGAALVRGAAVAAGEPSRLAIEFWPVMALAVGVFASIAWVRTGSRPSRLAEWALAASVTAASIPTVIAIMDDRQALIRTAVLLSTLAGLHIANAAATARPIGGPVVRWASLGVVVLAGAVVLGAGTVDPFDVVTVPVGAALVGAGAVRMRLDRTLRSWPALGPGVAVVLVPALLADWTDPDLWRLVALGIAAVVTVVAGAVLRLQAPLVLGGAVLLVHAVAQLWPWISWLYEAVWWWLWLGVAGALLVTIAATYERQLRLARGVVRTIAGLR